MYTNKHVSSGENEQEKLPNPNNRGKKQVTKLRATDKTIKNQQGYRIQHHHHKKNKTQQNLMNIVRTVFLSAQGTFTKIDHILCQRVNLNKFKRMEIIQIVGGGGCCFQPYWIQTRNK